MRGNEETHLISTRDPHKGDYETGKTYGERDHGRWYCRLIHPFLKKRNSMRNVCLIEVDFCKNHAKCIALKIYIDTKHLVKNRRNLKRECRTYLHNNGKIFITFYKIFSYWKPWTEKNQEAKKPPGNMIQTRHARTMTLRPDK